MGSTSSELQGFVTEGIVELARIGGEELLAVVDVFLRRVHVFHLDRHGAVPDEEGDVVQARIVIDAVCHLLEIVALLVVIAVVVGIEDEQGVIQLARLL